ncbi:hypothetical protein [Lutimonas sp.]|uniref:hypothetical protein n=1 Tax=Lutimonas sp. TaxID=1872403 RepID=UPI003D9B4434
MSFICSKNKSFFYAFLVLLIIGLPVWAQDVTTITASDDDISDNLDLEAVASIFGESKDLEDFEKRLNDPKTQISNLDLNNDGEVDYLRVMETSEKNVHSISIQAIIGKDQYQEVAVIDVQKDKKGSTQVQVVGNVNMYGPNYYITPYYPVVPVFFSLFWVAAYRPWYSPWYWGYHPPYFRPWPPISPYRYRTNVHVHVNIHNTYTRNNVRINNRTNNINTRNNDYFKNNPDKSFNKRNPGASNRNELVKDRKARPANKGVNTDRGYKSSGRPVQKPNNKQNTRPATKPNNRPSTKPNTRPSYSKPNTRPSTKPSTRPSTKPSTRPSSRPSYNNKSSRPSNSRPSSRPSSNRRPASRSSHMRTRH